MSFQAEIDRAIKEKRLYFLGEQLPTDWYAGFRVWLPLAEQGDPKAQFNVGRSLNFGAGIDEDLGEAERWYLAAAASGEARSLHNLALMYGKSSSPVFNPEKSEHYRAKALQAREPRALAAAAKDEETQREKVAKEAYARFEEYCSALKPMVEAVNAALDKGDQTALERALAIVGEFDPAWVEASVGLRELKVKLYRGPAKHDDRYSEYLQDGNTRFSRSRTTQYPYSALISNPSKRTVRLDFKAAYLPDRGVDIPPGGTLTQDMGLRAKQDEPRFTYLSVSYIPTRHQFRHSCSIRNTLDSASTSKASIAAWMVGILACVMGLALLS